MTGELSPIDKAKFVAAKKACDYVESGMRVGLDRDQLPHGWSNVWVNWFVKTD